MAEIKRENNNVEKKTKSQSKVPHIYVILFILIALAAIATYIVPSGQFDRVEDANGTETIQPGTFDYIESTPASFFDFMFAIPLGIEQSISIIFGIMAIGGMFSVIERTRIIDLGVNKLTSAFSSKGLLLIPILMIPFSIFTSITGTIELSLIYIPAILPLILKLGFDKITALAIVLVSTVVGQATAISAPATVGTAQTIAQIPLYSGYEFRAIVLVVALTLGTVYVWRYAKKVRANPKLSIVYDPEIIQTSQSVKDEALKATKRQIIASIVLILSFVFMFYALLQLSWSFIELSGLYIFMGITVGLITGLKPSEIAETFNEGIKNIILGALVVGVARAISVVLTEGQILDTIVYGVGILIEDIPSTVVPVFMMVVQMFLNFVVPSGSGQAAVTMPIMVGLADITEVTRQTTVLAFQFGDGFTNILYPTSGYFMAALAIVGVPWTKWARFILPLIIALYAIGAIFLIIAQLINYGPI